MSRPLPTSGLLILALLAGHACAQTGQPIAKLYQLTVAVDEAILTFHAADAHGLPVNDLKLDELRLRDNGRPPAKILSLQLLQDFPIRAGVLIDTSKSMEPSLPHNRATSIQYAQQLLRQKTDQAFVMDFGYISRLVQPWTSDPAALTAAIRSTTAGRQNPLGGTALFDTLFRACFNEFGKVDHAASGNFILLFSDGEDNASHIAISQVVDICQRSNTAIYAFRPEPIAGSSGPSTLSELTSQTGGRLFFDDSSDAEIKTSLRTIEADLRNQYRLVYKPAELKHDSSFHRIELHLPDRVDSTNLRSGYYDLPH